MDNITNPIKPDIPVAPLVDPINTPSTIKLREELMGIDNNIDNIVNINKPVRELGDKSNIRSGHFNIKHQTFVALFMSLMYLLINIIIHKKHKISYYYIIILIFIWPTFIELLCHYYEGSILTWILTITPIVGMLSYEYYEYQKKKEKRRLRFF